MGSSISVIIPAYNEETRIAATIESLKPYAAEIIVIDDASSDNTASVAEVAGAIVYKNERNLGHLETIKKGFGLVNNEIIVTFDADGEFPADSIPTLVAPIERGEADMVQANRDFYPRPSEKLLNWMANLAGPVGDTGTGLRAIKKSLAERLELKGNCICGIFGLEVLYHGGRIAEVPVGLLEIDKSRRIVWHHFSQFFHILKWIIKYRRRVNKSTV